MCETPHQMQAFAGGPVVRWSFLGGVVLEEGTSDYFYGGSINHCLTTRLLISRISCFELLRFGL